MSLMAQLAIVAAFASIAGLALFAPVSVAPESASLRGGFCVYAESDASVTAEFEFRMLEYSFVYIFVPEAPLSFHIRGWRQIYASFLETENRDSAYKAAGSLRLQ